jgi:RimJ/RimL family protein N-acetyltransferase
VLRAFREDDFEAALALEQDAAAARWVPALPGADGASVAAFYDECRREGGLLHLVIADRASNDYLGEVMLALSEHQVGEVGICLTPAARGRGIAIEAVRLLTGWALSSLGLGRAQVFIATQNAAALRVAEGAVFGREGVLRSYWEEQGVRLDVVVLSRLPGDEA